MNVELNSLEPTKIVFKPLDVNTLVGVILEDQIAHCHLKYNILSREILNLAHVF